MNLFDFNSEEMIIDEENKILKFKNFGDESVENLFTLKPFDFNRKYIDDEFICKQYKKLERILDFKIRFKKPIQTHTNIVKILDEENFEDDFNDVDGLITQMKGVGIASSSADCQAVIFYDVKNKVIANVHSGWKGTLNKIVENTVNIMKDKFNTDTSELEVGIYPSISRDSFEVDEDLKDIFLEKFENIDNLIDVGEVKEGKQKYFIDTVGINVKILKELGVKEENIHLSGIDTLTNKDIIHSHRGDGVSAGRNIAIIAMKN